MEILWSKGILERKWFHTSVVCVVIWLCFSPPWLNILSWANRGSPRHLFWSEMCLCEEAQNTCFILFLSCHYIIRIKPLRTSNIRLIIQKSRQPWHFGWSVKTNFVMPPIYLKEPEQVSLALLCSSVWLWCNQPSPCTASVWSTRPWIIRILQAVQKLAWLHSLAILITKE